MKQSPPSARSRSASVRQALIGSHYHFAALFNHQRQRFLSAYNSRAPHESPPSVSKSFSIVILSSRLNSLMLLSLVALSFYAIPPESLAEFPTINTLLFISSLMGLIPFAERLGFVTEQLALHTNDTYGGLLNATFGNASELIFCCFALRDRLYRVVQLSLLGSILSNLLFVLGLSCFVGGLRYKVQTFKKVSGAVSSGMLMLASISLLLPAAMKFSGQEDDATDEIYFSRFTALIMIIMYVAYLFFQLRTHVGEFENSEQMLVVAKLPSDNPESDVEMSLLEGGGGTEREEEEEEGLDVSMSAEVALLTFWECIGWLFVFTIFVSLLSDIIVNTLEEFTAKHNISGVFLAAVILPLFGNAAEHAASVVFAYRNKMDICLGIAIGSSIQIALCVVPFCVLIGWATGRELSLFFDGFETASLLVSVVTVCFLLQGGTSNWLVGLLLMCVYAIVCEGFWIHKLETIQ